MRLRRARLSPFLWAFAALVSFMAAYYSKNAMMEIQSWLIGRSATRLPTGSYYAVLGSIEVLSVLVVSLIIPVLVGVIFQSVAPDPKVPGSFILTSLTFSVVAFFSDLVSMGAIGVNPVSSLGSPPVLFLMEPIDALQSFVLTALPTGFAAGAFLFLGSSLMRKREARSTPLTRGTDGVIRSQVPWLIAGFLAVLPLCAAAMMEATFNSGVNSYPASWPLARSVLAAATMPISAVLGYLSQRVDFGFSLRRCFILPTFASFLLYTGFAGIGFGFEFLVPTVLSTPTALFIMASVSLPVALTVGGMMFVASRIAVRHDEASASILQPTH